MGSAGPPVSPCFILEFGRLHSTGAIRYVSPSPYTVLRAYPVSEPRALSIEPSFALTAACISGI